MSIAILCPHYPVVGSTRRYCSRLKPEPARFTGHSSFTSNPCTASMHAPPFWTSNHPLSNLCASADPLFKIVSVPSLAFAQSDHFSRCSHLVGFCKDFQVLSFFCFPCSLPCRVFFLRPPYRNLQSLCSTCGRQLWAEQIIQAAVVPPCNLHDVCGYSPIGDFLFA